MSNYKSFNWFKGLLFFAVPGVWMLLNMRYLLPVLLGIAWPLSISVYVCVWLPIIVQTVYVLSLWYKSNVKFQDFFWISKLTKRDWAIVAIAFFVVQLGEAGFKILSIEYPVLSIGHAPEFYPDLFQHDYLPSFPMESFMGMTLKGNWFAVLFWVMWLITNIGGEELLWRGYALPRMEVYFGSWAWLVNGLLWNVVIHSFMSWSWITLLPISLVVPYLCQKTKSIWPGIFIHGLGNFLVFLVLIPSILQ